MADRTKIEWADATLNYVNGCSLSSPGCTNCYAMRLAGTRMRGHPSRAGLTQPTMAGPVWTGEVRTWEPALEQALRWRRPRKIFWNAHGDLFHPSVPDGAIHLLFAVCAATPQHTHMILTKRPARMREYCTDLWRCGEHALAGVGAPPEPWPFPNVWLGVSVEDQARADERIPELLATPAAVRFISAEPLLGPVDLFTPIARWQDQTRSAERQHIPLGRPLLDLVIAGGESGPGARPMHPAWVRSLRDQCQAAGVAFDFKQWGAWAPISEVGEDLIEAAYHPRPETHPLASRRCKVEQLVMHASGRIFPMDRWSRIGGENPASRDFAFAVGSGAMTFMRLGKRAAGRTLDGRIWAEAPPTAAEQLGVAA